MDFNSAAGINGPGVEDFQRTAAGGGVGAADVGGARPVAVPAGAVEGQRAIGAGLVGAYDKQVNGSGDVATEGVVARRAVGESAAGTTGDSTHAGESVHGDT